MGIFDKIEGKLDDAVEGVASTVFKSPIEPAQIAKRAEKQMHREKLVGTQVQYAPTLYTVLVNSGDDHRLFGFYPTMAAEIETYLMGKAQEAGYSLDIRPLVRFIVDEKMKSGKFDVVAEIVTSNTIKQLREEEAAYYNQSSSKKNAPHNVMQSMQLPNQELSGANLQREEIGQNVFNHASAKPDLGLSSAMGSPIIDSSLISKERTEEGLGLFVLFDMSSNTEYLLDSPIVSVGRENANIILDDTSVSRRHAELFMDESKKWFIKDLDSTNGTKLNGRKITIAPLNVGDKIAFGVTILEFSKE